jgi:hypothetical protein
LPARLQHLVDRLQVQFDHRDEPHPRGAAHS